MIRQRNLYAMRINLPPRDRCFSGSVGNPPQFQYEGLPIIGCNEVNFERAMGRPQTAAPSASHTPSKSTK
jgi:hypothetical protein